MKLVIYLFLFKLSFYELIQDESFKRIGGTKSIKVDIRIIAVITECKGTGKYHRKIGNSC